MVSLGGLLAAIGTGAAYYFNVATYEKVVGQLFGQDITQDVHYDPIYTAVFMVVAIMGGVMLLYGSLAKD